MKTNAQPETITNYIKVGIPNLFNQDLGTYCKAELTYGVRPIEAVNET